MRRPILFAVLAVAALDLFTVSASAQVFEDQSVLFGRRSGPREPWCSHEDTGGGNITEDCSFASFEACRRTLFAATSFCTQNPSYDLSVQPVRSRKGNRLPR